MKSMLTQRGSLDPDRTTKPVLKTVEPMMSRCGGSIPSLSAHRENPPGAMHDGRDQMSRASFRAVAYFIAGAILMAGALAACGNGRKAGVNLGDITYVLPEHLPAGWTLKIATERPGGGSTPSYVSDYTVSWVPADLAGASRSAAIALPDTGLTIFINVGSPSYAPSFTNVSANPADAPITSQDGLLEMRFLMSGSVVRLNGRDVDEAMMRMVADSLRAYHRADWRAKLGERLLVDQSS
jgi:hypothetical protein